MGRAALGEPRRVESRFVGRRRDVVPYLDLLRSGIGVDDGELLAVAEMGR